jgi:coenzyme F420-0:L-glutamate ligase/coenzyme F420-1:gamma-L-glutamate ligase
MTVQIVPVHGIPEVRAGDELADLILSALLHPPRSAGEKAPHGRTTTRGTEGLRDGDVVVVTQKVVSKAEGRLVAIDPDDLEARRALVEKESVRVLRRRGDLVISETRHGFVCANAGVDLSNVDAGQAALLPVDPDRSARHIRDALRARAGVDVGVIVSDTFGRAWRKGLTDVAIGCAGIAAVVDLRGTPDARGRVMQVTEVALADEIAAAAELVMGKASGVPVAVVRGLDPSWLRESSVRAELVRPPAEDLFR